MTQLIRSASASTLAVLLSAAALVGCGGGDDPAAAAASNNSSASSDLAFATPTSTTATSEGGTVFPFSFFDSAGTESQVNTTFASAAVTNTHTLGGTLGFAGVAVRLYGPTNIQNATATPLDASSFSKLKIKLASSTDATLSIKLQPNPINSSGCVPVAVANVNATTTELVINLDSTTFQVPAWCSSGITTFAAAKSALYAIDVVNESTAVGAHDVTVGSTKLAP